MKKIFSFVVSLLICTSCGQGSKQEVTPKELAQISWIEDNPEPTIQPHDLYPDVPDSLWNALGLQDGVPSGTNCFLLQTEGTKILVDTGLGAPTSQLLTRLSELGVSPQELGRIYLTHLHRDHIGGMLKDGKKVFPNAEVFVNRIEAEAWLAMQGEKSQQAKAVLAAYKDRLHLFEAGDTLEGGVRAIEAYGHTPGHTVFQKDSILVIGDLIHGLALQLKYPEYSATYDMDAEQAKASRRRILEYARDNGLTIYGMHVPAPGVIDYKSIR